MPARGSDCAALLQQLIRVQPGSGPAAGGDMMPVLKLSHILRWKTAANIGAVIELSRWSAIKP
jgi:hypothetical protein